HAGGSDRATARAKGRGYCCGPCGAADWPDAACVSTTLSGGAMKAVVRKCGRVQHRPTPRTNERRLVTQHPRRRVLSLAAGAAWLPGVSRISWAQAYPSRPVRLIVGYPAAGANDIFARLIADWLSKQFGRSFIVENRPGAASNIATEAVVRAPADGYT